MFTEKICDLGGYFWILQCCQPQFNGMNQQFIKSSEMNQTLYMYDIEDVLSHKYVYIKITQGEEIV